MAVGKAPIPNICIEAAACRQALEAVVAEFTETFAATPVATIKKRLRNADIVIPFANGNGSPYEIEVRAEIPVEGLDKKL